MNAKTIHAIGLTSLAIANISLHVDLPDNVLIALLMVVTGVIGVSYMLYIGYRLLIPILKILTMFFVKLYDHIAKAINSMEAV